MSIAASFSDKINELFNTLRLPSQAEITRHEAEQREDDKDFKSALRVRNIDRAMEIAKAKTGFKRVEYLSEIINACKVNGRVMIAHEAAGLLGIFLGAEELLPMFNACLAKKNLDSIRIVLSLMPSAYRYETIAASALKLKAAGELRFMEQLLHTYIAVEGDVRKSQKSTQHNQGEGNRKKGKGRG